MNIGSKLVPPVSDESAESAEKREKDVASIVRDALDHSAGHKLLSMLSGVAHPMSPRFANNRTNELAAFDDGQKDVVGFLLLHGTNKKIL